MARGASRGSRTTPRLCSHRRICPCPRCCAAAFASSTCRSPTRARLAWSWTRCRCRCPRARLSPSSARTAPARRRWSNCSRRCTSRRRGPFSSTARGFMRDGPLLLVLDEPTAALDAETEHALFERCAAAAHGERADGRITILVSHRFSTVRMADLIVVMSGARLVEVGTHDELMAKGGQYAEIYGIQAAAYR